MAACVAVQTLATSVAASTLPVQVKPVQDTVETHADAVVKNINKFFLGEIAYMKLLIKEGKKIKGLEEVGYPNDIRNFVSFNKETGEAVGCASEMHNPLIVKYLQSQGIKKIYTMDEKSYETFVPELKLNLQFRKVTEAEKRYIRPSILRESILKKVLNGETWTKKFSILSGPELQLFEKVNDLAAKTITTDPDQNSTIRYCMACCDITEISDHTEYQLAKSEILHAFVWKRLFGCK